MDVARVNSFDGDAEEDVFLSCDEEEDEAPPRPAPGSPGAEGEGGDAPGQCLGGTVGADGPKASLNVCSLNVCGTPLDSFSIPPGKLTTPETSLEISTLVKASGFHDSSAGAGVQNKTMSTEIDTQLGAQRPATDQDLGSGPTIHNKSLERVTQCIQSEQNTQSIPLEELTQSIPSETTTQSITSEQITQRIPSEQITQRIPSEPTTQSIPSEPTKQSIPSEQNTQSIPLEESTQSIPSEQITQRIPSEQITQRIPPELTMQRIPLEQTTLIPSELTSQSIPVEESTQSIPSESTTQSIPSEPTTQSIPSELTSQSIPLEVSTQSIPSEPTTQSIPSEQTIQSIPSEQATQSIQLEESTQSIPSEPTTQSVPLETTIQSIPSEPTTQSIPSEQTIQSIPSGQPTQSIPLKESTQYIPSEQTTQSIPSEQTTQSISSEPTTQSIPSEQTIQSIPSEQTTQSISLKESTQSIPSEPTTQSIPSEQTTQSIPLEQTTQSIPLEQTTQSILLEESTQSIASESTTQSILSELTSHIIPSEHTTQSIPSEHTTQSIPSEHTTQSIPSEQIESIPIDQTIKSISSEQANQSVPSDITAQSNTLKETTQEIKLGSVSQDATADHVSNEAIYNGQTIHPSTSIEYTLTKEDCSTIDTIDHNKSDSQVVHVTASNTDDCDCAEKLVENLDEDFDDILEEDIVGVEEDAEDYYGYDRLEGDVDSDENFNGVGKLYKGVDGVETLGKEIVDDTEKVVGEIINEDTENDIEDIGDSDSADEWKEEDSIENVAGDDSAYLYTESCGRVSTLRNLYGIQPPVLFEVPEEVELEANLNALPPDIIKAESGLGHGNSLITLPLTSHWSDLMGHQHIGFVDSSCDMVDDVQAATDSEDDNWSVDSLCEAEKLSISVSSSLDSHPEAMGCSMGSSSRALGDRFDDSLDCAGSLDGRFADTDSGYVCSISMVDSLNSLQFIDVDYHSMDASHVPSCGGLGSHQWSSSNAKNLTSVSHLLSSVGSLQIGCSNYLYQDDLETPKVAKAGFSLDIHAPYPQDMDHTPTPSTNNMLFCQLETPTCHPSRSEDIFANRLGNCRAFGDVHEDDSLDEEDNRVSKNISLSKNSLSKGRIDPVQAKLRASLSWLLSKVYGSDVPKELQDPFYQTAEGQVVLRPVMVNYMSSSELYCQACCNMFPETHTQWKGHWSIIQVLSRKGIYISDETSVTETVLVQTAPIKLKAHLALIDAIMRAYINEVASVEKVVIAVKRFTTFPASSELPMTSEEALSFWINKICTVLGNPAVEGTAAVGGPDSAHKSRAISKPAVQRDPIYVPQLQDLMRDIGDGCSVAAVIGYYRPHLLNIQDLCLKDSVGIADSLYNLRQIGEFCRNHLPWKSFHLTYEDLLYTHETMKVNIVAFLADLFYCFEGPGSPESGTNSAAAALIAAKEKIDAMPAAGKKSSLSTVTTAPISAATKKSFQRLPFEDTASNLGMARSSAISPTSHQPLLSRRAGGRRAAAAQDDARHSPPSIRRGRRTMSLSSPQDRDTIHRSVLAWQDDQKITPRSHSQNRGNLLTNASIDSSLNQSLNADNLSLDLSELDQLDTPRVKGSSALDPNHPDYMELESLASGQPSRFATPQQAVTDRPSSRATPVGSGGERLEPLTPAVLKPTKEKDTNFSKAEERGDRSHRRKQVISPSVRPPSVQQQPSSKSSNDDLTVSLSSSSEETTVSSLPSGESQSPRLNIAQQLASKPYEAFTIGPDLSQQLDISPLNSARSNAISTAGSYTVDNRVTPQAARAAGIPIVADSADTNHVFADGGGLSNRSREGSVASSGEYSDHESQKIHQDHKVRESGPVAFNNANNSNIAFKPGMVVVAPPDRLGSTTDEGKLFIKMSPSQTTNFAELKRLKDKLGHKIDQVDNSALIYMQSGTQGGAYDKLSVGQGLKSTLSNQLGSGQSGTGKVAQQGVTSPSPLPGNLAANSNGNAEDGGSSDMQQLRLKLEQKRKEIERKKHRQEAQQNKIRQRLGKAAFMRVVSKHLEGGEEDEALEGAEPSEQADSLTLSTQAQLQARLGHPIQRLPLGQAPRAQPTTQGHPLQAAAGQVIPPETSAQRFTDWTNVSKANQQTSSKDDQQQTMVNSCPGDLGLDSSNATKLANRAFSREGIQQTIDNVKNKWFRSNSDLVSGGQGSEDEVDTFRLHNKDLVGRARREHSQSPIVMAGSSTPVPIPAATPHVRDTASPRPNAADSEYQEYDSSLDKLNNSLTELQGEIMRLSLQHEQLKAAQTPTGGQTPGFDPRLSDALEAIGSTAAGTTPSSRPIHGIPQQAAYVHAAMVRKQASDTPKSTSQLSNNSLITDSPLLDQTGGQSIKDRFFIEFVEDTPKRPNPKVATDTQGASPSPQVTPAGHGFRAPPVEEPPEEAVPAVGFIIKDEEAKTSVQVHDDEMQKKKVKLIEMQKKRKEEQEKRRLEKEAEMQKKMEEKIQKEEEVERKKAEDKARREVIFQQYLQKKQEDEEQSPASRPRIKKRDGSSSGGGGKPRPKSMFVKSKAATPEPGAMGGFESGSSSQEDLTGRNNGGRSTPGVMSVSYPEQAMRSAYHFRLPPPSSGIRKAVSCQQLQGSPNGAQGPATYRRPPSPDLYKIRQQRQRGNSQDSGSETGSGSNPGSDYAGPKLFVKPSAKSNRHIIVNAISHCCLAGSVNTDMKNKVLEELSKCDANHFLILFRDAGCQYRGLFIFYPETEEAFKVHGVGPKHITNKMCEKFYKYNSGGKSFMEITSTKHLSVSVDAVVLQGTVWKTNKAVVKR